MKERASYVQAVAMLSEEDPRAGYVGQQTNDRYNQHLVRLYGRRIHKTMVCLIKDVERHENQKNAIKERCKDFHSIKAVGHSWSGAPARETNCEETQTESRNIRKHVAGVGKECQRVCVQGS